MARLHVSMLIAEGKKGIAALLSAVLLIVTALGPECSRAAAAGQITSIEKVVAPVSAVSGFSGTALDLTAGSRLDARSTFDPQTLSILPDQAGIKLAEKPLVVLEAVPIVAVKTALEQALGKIPARINPYAYDDGHGLRLFGPNGEINAQAEAVTAASRIQRAISSTLLRLFPSRKGDGDDIAFGAGNSELSARSISPAPQNLARPIVVLQSHALYAAPQEKKGRSFLWGALKKSAGSFLPASKGKGKAPASLFSVLQINGKRVIDIRPDQLDKPYLFSAVIKAGTGENGLFAEEMADSFLWQFHREGDNIQFIRINSYAGAKEKSPEYWALKQSFPDSIIASFPIMRSASGALRISADALLTQDFVNMLDRLREGYRSKSLSAADSTVERVQSFGRNLEVQVQKNFVNPESGQSELADSRFVTVTMHYSLAELPENSGREPRSYDERVGYFTASHMDFSPGELQNKAEPSVHYIHTWNLEKRDPAADISEVRNPIVYWIDRSVPDRFRPAIKAGVLAWNAAFEAVGLKSAIMIKEVDRDMSPEQLNAYDPADMAYNVITWFMAHDGGFAQGPSLVHPLTGEILKAEIRVDDAMTRSLARKAEYIEAQDKAAEMEKMAFQYVAHFIMHEVGHNLGLRHNMAASSTVPADKVGEDGILTNSVMDYLPFNIGPAGQQKGPYFQTKPGVYDLAAIRYGYAPLNGDAAARQAQLQAVADEFSRDPRLAYNTDEDMAAGADPDVMVWTLGDDNVAFAQGEADRAKRFIERLKTRPPARDEGYGTILDSLDAALTPYVNAVNAVLPVIGGIRTSRVRPGDAKPPFAVVPAQEQRRALQFLDQEIFNMKIDLSPQLLAQIAPDRRNGEYKPVKPISMSKITLKIQTAALNGLFDGARLQRIVESRRLAAQPQDALPIQEFMDTVREAIFRELGDADLTDITESRRNLQLAYLDVLNGLNSGGTGLFDLLMAMFKPQPPNEAKNLVKYEKDALKELVEKAQNRKEKLTLETRLHLDKLSSSLL